MPPAPRRRCHSTIHPTAVATPTPTPPTQQQQQSDTFTEEEWKSFSSSYTSQYKEHALFLDHSAVIEGAIPPQLQGTLLRNGPALYEIGGRRIPQPFDGDGMVAAFGFPGDGRPPFVANRFVRSADFLAEQEAGKMLFRGAFSVGNPSGSKGLYNPFDLSVKKVANTGVVYWAKHLLALYERDLPYHMSTPELRTAGQTTLGGEIDGPYFGAHYRIDPGTNRLVGFHSREAGLDNHLTVWEFDSEQGRQVHKTEITVPNAAFGFFHDFVITPRHYIFIENPIRLDLGKMLTKYMFGRACIAECLVFDASKKTKIHVIARPSSDAVQAPARHAVYTTPLPFFSFHHVNAYENSGDGSIVLDTIAMTEGMDFGAANLDVGAAYFSNNSGRGSLTRLKITPWKDGAKEEGREGERAVEMTKLLSRAVEFPCVHPRVVGRPHSHVYMVGSRINSYSAWGPPQGISKATTVRQEGSGGSDLVEEIFYTPGPGKWVGEPMFVPKNNSSAEKEDEEDDGWVLTVVFDSTSGAGAGAGAQSDKTSELVILNAKDLSVAASVQLPFFLPAGLHGSWTQTYLGPDGVDADAVASWQPKEYDIRHGAAKYSSDDNE